MCREIFSIDTSKDVAKIIASYLLNQNNFFAFSSVNRKLRGRRKNWRVDGKSKDSREWVKVTLPNAQSDIVPDVDHNSDPFKMAF